MKSLLLAFLLFPVVLISQNYKGFRAGGNVSKTINLRDASEMIPGWQIGGFLGADKSGKYCHVFEFGVQQQGYRSENPSLSFIQFYVKAASVHAFRLGGDQSKIRFILAAQPTYFLGENNPTNQQPVYCNEDGCFQKPKSFNLEGVSGLEFWGKLRYCLRASIGFLSKERFQNFGLEFSLGI